MPTRREKREMAGSRGGEAPLLYNSKYTAVLPLLFLSLHTLIDV